MCKKSTLGTACQSSHELQPVGSEHHLVTSSNAPRRENDVDTDLLIENLRSGKYQALVLDAPVLQYLAGTDKLCDLFVVGQVRTRA